jgi:hypothetical protein
MGHPTQDPQYRVLMVAATACGDSHQHPKLATIL